MTWTLKLRDGLRFHDNEPVLARDVVASIRRFAPRVIFANALMETTGELSAPDVDPAEGARSPGTTAEGGASRDGRDGPTARGRPAPDGQIGILRAPALVSRARGASHGYRFGEERK